MRMLAALAPGVFLALILGTFHGALAHLLLGRHWSRLPVIVLAAILGCQVVWGLHHQLQRSLPAPGGLPLLEASIMAWLLLTPIAVWRRA